MMKQLDDRERRFVFLGVLAMLVVVPVLWAVGALDHDSLAAQRALMLGLYAACMAFGAWKRSRILSGFAIILLGFGPWGRAWMVGMPYLLLGMWLWFRGKPSQEEIMERRKIREANIAEKRAAKAAARGAGKTPAGSGARTSSPKPPPNKRYTPPKR